MKKRYHSEEQIMEIVTDIIPAKAVIFAILINQRLGEAPAADVVERPRWIPVGERLPDTDVDVLVMVHWRDYPEDMMCYGRRFKTRWYLWNGELGELNKGFDITHWMPLPEPPKEE